jgi:hypothetical protein
LLRDDDLRDDVLRAVARPPRAPAVRTDILPEPLFRVVDFVEVDERCAVTRPPFAPAFFFCATLPARPPFAPAFLTVIVRRPVFRVELVLAREDDVFERDVVVFREREVPAVLFDERLALAFRPVVVPDFFRDDVPPPRDAEDDLRDEPLRPEDDRDDDDEDDDDFVSPACERCLLTVRAAISFARFVDRPCFFSESLMCSYCRSRFALHASGICV